MPVNDKSTNRRELDLQGLFFAVLAKYKLILFCAVLGASAMGYYRLRMVTPYYTATCKLYALNAQGITLNSSLLNIGSELKYDYEEILTTWVVQEKVMQNLQMEGPYSTVGNAVSVKAATDSRIITITATYPNPHLAQEVANEYARVSQKYIARIMGTDEPSMVSTALLPTRPINAFRRFDVMEGFVLGMLFPVGIIALLYIFRDRIRTAEDLEACLGVPNLAVLPSENIPGRKRRKKNERV
ncbi:MAG: hypothetical protein IKE58_00285 [Blautia sp.]|nr:hypothetical protein [Blautia sp.]